MTTGSQIKQLLQEMCFRDNIFILENIEKQIDMQNIKEWNRKLAIIKKPIVEAWLEFKHNHSERKTDTYTKTETNTEADTERDGELLDLGFRHQWTKSNKEISSSVLITLKPIEEKKGKNGWHPSSHLQVKQDGWSAILLLLSQNLINTESCVLNLSMILFRFIYHEWIWG